MTIPQSKGKKTWATIRSSGIRLLYEQGYQGMSLRLLAKESGLKVGSLYNYIDNKEGFVADIMCDTMRELMSNITAGLETADNSVDQIKIYIKVMVDWNTSRKEESMIALSETRILPKSHIGEFYQLRRQFETIIHEVVAKGKKLGLFAVNDAKLTSIAIFSMLAGISIWYQGNGRLKPAQIAEEYTGLILNMLNTKSIT